MREAATRLGALLRRLLTDDDGAHLRAIEDSGLTLTQTKAMLVLASPAEDEAPISVKALGERLGAAPPAISRAVDGLVRKRLVTRVEDPEDRRVRRIAVTAKGQRLADELIETRLVGLEAFVASLTAAQRRKLDAALAALLEREDVADPYEAIRRGTRR